MYNGWPATYADISAGLTFQRNIANEIDRDLSQPQQSVAVLLGAAGVGKSTAARQAV